VASTRRRAEYDESLRQRGDLTVWISDYALDLWEAAPRKTPGGQPSYSDLAIELCLTLGIVFKQPLRQTEGLMSSIAGLLRVEIAVPHLTTLSRRGHRLSLSAKAAPKSGEPMHLVVDSTGLKIFGEGEWLEQKHKTTNFLVSNNIVGSVSDAKKIVFHRHCADSCWIFECIICTRSW
jgi:hypothetical protein